MWPLAGGVLVLGGLLPSALLSLSGWLSADGLWRAAAAYSAVDTVFAASATMLLAIAVRYGNTRTNAKTSQEQQPAPYPGAWVQPDGRQVVPRGFPSYLAVAFVISIVVPALVLASGLLSSQDTTRALVTAVFIPYFIVFVPQILLETKFLNRSFMTPVLPVLFAYYRFWQFIRSLSLVAGPHAAAEGQHTLLTYYLLSLMAFWVFDTGCTMVWLPGMFEWQLQDAALLTRLSKQQQQQRQRHEHPERTRGDQPKAPQSAADTEQISSPAMAAKLRRKLRAADAQRGAASGSGDYDSYNFGT